MIKFINSFWYALTAYYQRQVPGSVYLNESSRYDRQIPGGDFKVGS